MQTVVLCVAIAVAAIGLTAVPSLADHNALVSAEQGEAVAPERSSVDVDLKLGLNGFRLGARVFGHDGETRPDGFSVDGRLERDGGKSWNFKLNADIDEALRRAMRWWGGGLTL